MALFKDWHDFADQKSAQPDAQKFWAGYFLREKDFYAELLKSEPISGTVRSAMGLKSYAPSPHLVK